MVAIRQTPQLARWLVVGGALALLLGGLAVPAGAEDSSRPARVAKANAFIDACFKNGGEPDAETEDDLGFIDVMGRVVGPGALTPICAATRPRTMASMAPTMAIVWAIQARAGRSSATGRASIERTTHRHAAGTSGTTEYAV